MLLPQHFGPYLLLKRIGSGGMADVFLATARGSEGFEKLVCIKMIRDTFADDPQFISLLVEEAKIVSHIVHPNIAQVFDLAKAQQRFYIVMEYVDGVDCYAMLRSASEKEVHMPLEAAVRIVRDVAVALGHAHAQTDSAGKPLGVIHRDITPHNLLVSLDGEVKIIDFGVAKAAMRCQQTAAGVIKGKYNYLSPEQANGEPMDHRTDLFNAGIVLYELLTGEPLYAGEHPALLLEAARKAKIPRVDKVREGLPKPLVKLVHKALSRKPSDRWATGEEMGAALDEFLVQHAPGYGAQQLSELVCWLCPPAAKAKEVANGSLLPMRPSEYIASEGSLVLRASDLVLPPPAVVRSARASIPQPAPPPSLRPPPAPPRTSVTPPQPLSTLSSSSELDAAPTRIADRRDITERRMLRAQGVDVEPVPIERASGSSASDAARAGRRVIVGVAVAVALLLLGALVYALWPG